ncbi:MAG: helix-turn-helix transcriptional regulator [Bacteroides sp.]|nr:helix-turn-helix transcriptional regulator [Bacteroides sp.]
MRVKELIKKKGYSMQDLAEKLGITRDTLTRNINGTPTVETLKKIASALGVELWELFTESTSKEELNALIQHKGDFYRASTLKELEKVVEKIRGNGVIPVHKNIRGKEYYQ